MKGFTRIIVIGLLAMFATITGVFATWRYAEQPTGSKVQQVGMTVVGFFWENAGTLPEDSDAGENHIALIERIINSEEGLNTPSSHLNDVINQRVDLNKNTASSVAPTKGGNLKRLFNTSEMRELHFNLYFTVHNGQITEYFLYTFERSILGNKQDVQVSPVYKTQITLQDGVWKAVKSWLGSARTIYYDTQQGSGKDMTIAPTTWQETIKTDAQS